MSVLFTPPKDPNDKQGKYKVKTVSNIAILILVLKLTNTPVDNPIVNFAFHRTIQFFGPPKPKVIQKRAKRKPKAKKQPTTPWAIHVYDFIEKNKTTRPDLTYESLSNFISERFSRRGQVR